MMTANRAQQIIACYGGHFEQWSVAKRLALQNLLLSGSESNLNDYPEKC